MKKYVKNAILRQEETRVAYSEISGTRVGGSFIKHRVGKSIAQGANLGQRTGADIYMTYIKIQTNTRLENTDTATNPFTGTGKIRLLLVEDKEPDVADTSDTIASRLFESEGDTNSPVAHPTTGNYLQIIKRINRMRYTVHHDSVIELKVDSMTDATGALRPRLSDRTACKTFILPVNKEFRFRDNYSTSPRGIDPCYYILWFYENDKNSVTSQFAETMTFQEYYKDA